jgi:hypothetical protein
VCPHCKQVINPGEQVHRWEGMLWHTMPCPRGESQPDLGHLQLRHHLGGRRDQRRGDEQLTDDEKQHQAEAYDCLSCGARPGESCTTPSGKIARWPHQPRWDALYHEIGYPRWEPPAIDRVRGLDRVKRWLHEPPYDRDQRRIREQARKRWQAGE